MSFVKEESAVGMNWLTVEHVKQFIHNYGFSKQNICIDKYTLRKASDKMLGFLPDYWKLTVYLSPVEEICTLSFFIKAVSNNASKADMVRDLKLFEKEINFYDIIKRSIELQDIKPWSPKITSAHKEAIVLEDLNALGYMTKNKFDTFDRLHTEQALRMLARFHACSIIYEHKKRQLQRSYNIYEEFESYLDKGGYYDTNVWFEQCMKGALAATKSYCKYKTDEEIISIIENRWKKIWSAALDLSNVFPEQCNVISHRDLWNNNILFRYKNVNNAMVPDDCMMVDFQAVRCQPPAGDVMLLLYFNLDPNFREESLIDFLRFYHKNLEIILSDHGVQISNVLPLKEFLESAENQRLWALILTACIVPQMWLDDDLTTKIFCDTNQFNEIISNDKAAFMKKMIENNDQYRVKVMQIFEEIVDRYCLV